MSQESIVVSVEAGIATVEINRPQVMNALAGNTIRALRAVLREIREDDRIRAVILTGRGRAFSTGADLGDPEIALDGPLSERPAKLAALMRNEINPLMEELQSFPKPTIAAVNGAAVGGGIGLALSADIVVAAESAYFMQVFTPKLGLVPDMGVTWHMERLVGRARAKGLSMLGNRLPARDAADWGLIWKTVPDADLPSEVRTLAQLLADAPPLGLRALSSILDEATGHDFAQQLERECVVQCGLVASEDAQEAVAAFREKRPARFVGR
ncbi:enoyl-CoA hydratase-related protein [Aminobacter sp. LjRoot7]|uniref:enoyl-CoA hydratase-related protein n=1 Tax=Aminobacter sp. LjRoot7 TaxID=3342335 RepID=UPI003ECFAF82